MLTYYRKPVSLSLICTDQPLWSVVETAVTLYQKDHNRFHLVLSAPSFNSPEVGNLNPQSTSRQEQDHADLASSPRQWCLEIAPEQVIMTYQDQAQVNYRHFWQQGGYGRTRYWLPNQSSQNQSSQQNEAMRLHNFTRSLILKGDPMPEQLRVEYELFAGDVQLGSYILNIELKH